jgi:hypothetical protein
MMILIARFEPRPEARIFKPWKDESGIHPGPTPTRVKTQQGLLKRKRLTFENDASSHQGRIPAKAPIEGRSGQPGPNV